ncbi:hypothetical protein [Xenococcus sp. PCC 7305]|uniref:hypothetical protein n=1 Tax=Xenococcus sp. PCC 7305 TaxID=102125 RepID=UPI00031A5493|nr:hypothetical protein [Xenococcus sp. PCC 7305]
MYLVIRDWIGYARERESGIGNRESGTGNREQGTGNREQGTGNREQSNTFASVLTSYF